MQKVWLYSIVLCTLLILPIISFAGEKEEIDLGIAYWQEHIRALQFDFELSQGKLKEAVIKKQAFEKKIEEESKKTNNEKTN